MERAPAPEVKLPKGLLGSIGPAFLEFCCNQSPVGWEERDGGGGGVERGGEGGGR